MPPRRSARAAAATEKLAQAPTVVEPKPAPQPTRKRVRARANQPEQSSDEEEPRQRGRSKFVKGKASAQQEDDTEEKENEMEEPTSRLPAAFPIKTMTSKVFEYSFIVQLMLECLSDHDVLVNMILASRTVNRSVTRYLVKTAISPQHPIIQVVESSKDVSKSQLLITPRLVITSAAVPLIFRNFDAQYQNIASWLPKSATRLEIQMYGSDQALPDFSNLSSHITHLEIMSSHGARDIGSLKSGSVPESVKSLTTNLVLSTGSIPSSVESFTWHQPTVQSIVETAPALKIGVFPDTIRKLVINFTQCGNIELGTFPVGVTTLSLSSFCNPHIIPSSVTDLAVNSHIQSLSECFPAKLKRLSLVGESVNTSNSTGSQSINQSIKQTRVIPDTVTELTYSYPHFTNRGLELQPGDLPPFLQVLDLGAYTHRLQPGVLPSTLKSLTMRGNNGGCLLERGILPRGLTHLKLLAHHVKVGFKPIHAGVIPSTVTHVEWEYDTKGKPLVVGSIPTSVKTLVFGPTFSRMLPIGFIPESVESVKFGDGFKNGGKPLDVGVIPFGVKYLRFGSEFDNGAKPFEIGVIPATVTHLYFPRKSGFKNGFQSLFTSIPASVEVLELPVGLTLHQAATRPPPPQKKKYRKYRQCSNGWWLSASESDSGHEWYTWWEMWAERND